MPRDFSHRETSDDYFAVVARAQRFRFILSNDDHQWIIQKRVALATSRSGGVWKAISYHRVRTPLIRAWNSKTKLPVPAPIVGLPENFSRRA